MVPDNQTPFFMDFVIVLPEGAVIETSSQVSDCVTWGVGGCDDD